MIINLNFHNKIGFQRKLRRKTLTRLILWLLNDWYRVPRSQVAKWLLEDETGSAACRRRCRGWSSHQFRTADKCHPADDLSSFKINRTWTNLERNRNKSLKIENTFILERKTSRGFFWLPWPGANLLALVDYLSEAENQCLRPVRECTSSLWLRIF